MCDLYNAMDVHVSTVSTLHIVCISIDRSDLEDLEDLEDLDLNFQSFTMNMSTQILGQLLQFLFQFAIFGRLIACFWLNNRSKW